MKEMPKFSDCEVYQAGHLPSHQEVLELRAREQTLDLEFDSNRRELERLTEERARLVNLLATTKTLVDETQLRRGVVKKTLRILMDTSSNDQVLYMGRGKRYSQGGVDGRHYACWNQYPSLVSLTPGLRIRRR